MVFLCRGLPAKVNRRMNIVLGTVYTLINSSDSGGSHFLYLLQANRDDAKGDYRLVAWTWAKAANSKRTNFSVHSKTNHRY